MKKTLLIAAAALAASVISSQAQVYSQNIVGYVNTPLRNGYSNLSNPLDAGGSLANNITNVLQNSGQFDGCLVSIWTGTTYNVVTIDSTVAGGVADANDNNPVTAPIVNPGIGFFIQNVNASNNITFVGTVHIDGVATGVQTVGVSTNKVSISPQIGYYASRMPVGGGIGTVLQLPHAPATTLDGSLISIPTINGAGNITGFSITTIDSTVGAGWADANDNLPVAEPLIPVASGFFIQNLTAGSQTWSQGL